MFQDGSDRWSTFTPRCTPRRVHTPVAPSMTTDSRMRPSGSHNSSKKLTHHSGDAMQKTLQPTCLKARRVPRPEGMVHCTLVNTRLQISQRIPAANTPIKCPTVTNSFALVEEVETIGPLHRPDECSRVQSTLSVSISAVSRPLELSLQSSLQLSLTVLVCYRFRGHI